MNAAGPQQPVCLGLICESDWQACAMMAKQLSSFPSHLKHITLEVIPWIIRLSSSPTTTPNCNPAVDLHWTYKMIRTHTNLIRSTERKVSCTDFSISNETNLKGGGAEKENHTEKDFIKQLRCSCYFTSKSISEGCSWYFMHSAY